MRINKVALAAEMARVDMNCKQLAALSGVSRVTITSIKSGKSCSKETAEKLARVLGRGIIEQSVADIVLKGD